MPSLGSMQVRGVPSERVWLRRLLSANCWRLHLLSLREYASFESLSRCCTCSAPLAASPSLLALRVVCDLLYGTQLVLAPCTGHSLQHGVISATPLCSFGDSGAQVGRHSVGRPGVANAACAPCASVASFQYQIWAFSGLCCRASMLHLAYQVGR
jgi:hypothetical protein